MTFGQLLGLIFTGNNLAILGAALATFMAGMGSAKGVNMVGKASAGLLSENPSLFGKTLVLQALPMTQGLYGFVTGFLILFKIGVLGGGAVELTVAQGTYYLFAALPIAIVGLYSAVKQAEVAVAGVALLSKRPDQLGKAITSTALVETYAIFAVLVSLLLILL